MDRTLGYEPRDASSSLAIPTMGQVKLTAHKHCVVQIQLCHVVKINLFSLKGRAVVKDLGS